MTLKKIYPGDVHVRRLRFAIRPYDIVSVISYVQNDPEHTISVALEVVLRRHFADRRDQKEETVSYTLSIIAEHLPTRSNRRNVLCRFIRTICQYRVLGFAGTMQRQLLHLHDIDQSTYHHPLDIFNGCGRDPGYQLPYTPLRET